MQRFLTPLSNDAKVVLNNTQERDGSMRVELGGEGFDGGALVAFINTDGELIGAITRREELRIGEAGGLKNPMILREIGS